jgi:hypothetical protein
VTPVGPAGLARTDDRARTKPPSRQWRAGDRRGRAGSGERATGEAERFWEERYRRKNRIWSGRVTPVLAEIAEPLEPGRALDPRLRRGR